MIAGLNRFEVQLTKVEQILNALPTSADRALKFYQTPARQWLFYLEALTHLYKEMHNKKRFERMRISFKSLEDQLGKIDYFDGFIKEFSVQDKFPPQLLANLKQHFADELVILEFMLTNEGWINHEPSTYKTIESELQGADWLPVLKDRKGVGEILMHEIDRIKSDYASGKLNFHDIENGVHEFRRQVRWISIYAQALNGLIQLKKVDTPDPHLKNYLTKEVLDSPFNVLPPVTAGVQPIYIEAPNFYALSWMIAESGRLKDAGLRIITIETAIRETSFVSEAELKPTTKNLAIKSTQSLKEIKATMNVIADKFMNHHKILDRIKNDIRQSIA